MKNPLKAGDRVAVYQQRAKFTGKVDRFLANGLIEIELDVAIDDTFMHAHPKQCRKLKPKRKPREYWITLPFVKVYSAEPSDFTRKGCAEVVHVREVLKK